MAQPLNAKARLCTSRLALYKAHECKFGSFFVHAQACGDIIDIVIAYIDYAQQMLKKNIMHV